MTKDEYDELAEQLRVHLLTKNVFGKLSNTERTVLAAISELHSETFPVEIPKKIKEALKSLKKLKLMIKETK